MAIDDAAQRLRVAFELHQVGIDLYRQRVRRQHADATPEDVESIVREWLHERPGAEHGDAVGPPSTRFT